MCILISDLCIISWYIATHLTRKGLVGGHSVELTCVYQPPAGQAIHWQLCIMNDFLGWQHINCVITKPTVILYNPTWHIIMAVSYTVIPFDLPTQNTITYTTCHFDCLHHVKTCIVIVWLPSHEQSVCSTPWIRQTHQSSTPHKSYKQNAHFKYVIIQVTLPTQTMITHQHNVKQHKLTHWLFQWPDK